MIRNKLFSQIKLGPLYKSWAEVDPIFNEISQRYPGVRMLRQDPVENLFSFICSSNNNIQRFTLNDLTEAIHYYKEL